MEQKVQEVLKYSFSHLLTVFSIIHILHWYGTFVTIDALLLIKAHSLHSLCVVQVHGFVKSIMSCIYWYSIIQNSFTALKIPCAPMYASSPPPPKPLATTYLFIVYSFAFSRMLYSWNYMACSLSRLASFTFQNAFKVSLCLFVSWQLIYFY